MIDSIKEGEVSDSNMTKIRELTIRGHETALKQNDRWLNAMMDADEDGRDQRDFLHVADRMLKVTKDQIRDAARTVPADGPTTRTSPCCRRTRGRSRCRSRRLDAGLMRERVTELPYEKRPRESIASRGRCRNSPAHQPPLFTHHHRRSAPHSTVTDFARFRG